MYDDFAILDADKAGLANLEYNRQGAGKILSVKSLQPDNYEGICQKINYLEQLFKKLKQYTKNQDTMLVLDNLSQDLQNQKDKLNVLLVSETVALGEAEPQTVIFCNNLKLAIQTTNEIVGLLIELKDSDQTAGEFRPQYTQIILSFLDINNILVSLFGECRYRVFKQKRLF